MINQPQINNFTTDLKQLDKLARSILLSTPDIPKQSALNKNTKAKILRIITYDHPQKLLEIVEKDVIALDTEIGTQGSKWNILHFCAKNNAYKCTDYVLKIQFQYYQQQYKKLLNEKTIEGYTPLVVSIINRSHEVLEKLLYYGGVDIQVLDKQKMSPYQIAINYKNDKAIRLLMSYEPKIKKKDFINKQALSIPLNFPKSTFYQNITNYILCCFTFGLYSNEDGLQSQKQSNIKNDPSTIEQTQIDYVPINSRKELQGYDIQWKRAVELMTCKVSMFDSYNPFEIQQTNFVIRNCLILFQCLSQQPWIIRRCIKAQKSKHNQYNVILYPHRLLETQIIDDFIPFIRQRKSAMFLSNHQQLWPMLLQKALAKQQGSYFSLSSLDPVTLLQNITGFPTAEIKLDTIQNQKIISFLQQISSKNYLFLLRGKKGSELSDELSQQSCCTVLNFYQKNEKSLILINCPFISQKWKQKQINQPLPLKLIKSHYNTHKQMCLWLQSSQIKQYFETVIMSLSFQNYQRSELKIKTNENVFFKFKIQNKRQDNIYLQLSNTSTQQIYNLSKLQIIKNEGRQLINLIDSDTKLYTSNLAQLQCAPGEYMCFYQTTQPLTLPQNLLLLCWSPEMLSTQLVESELGILEWLGFLKNHFCKIQTEQCVLEVIGCFSLVLLRENVTSQVFLRIGVQTEEVIEGRKDETTNFIQMISEGNIHYCVVKRIVHSSQITFDYKK